MILAGDVGGTKVDLGLYDFTNGKLKSTRDTVYKAKDYPGLEVIVKEFLGGDKVTAACFGVPGPVRNGRLRLVSAGDKEKDRAGVVDDRPGEGDAPCVLLLHVVGHGEAAQLVERGAMGKQRGGVAVRAHAQGDEVEAWGLGSLQAEAVAQLGLVAGGGGLGVKLSLDTVNLLWLEGHVVQHGLAGHAVVAVGVVRGYATLVHPVEIQVFPRHAAAPGLIGVGEQGKGGLGRGAAADGDTDPTAGLDRLAGHLNKILRCVPGQRRWIRLYVIFDP